MSANVVPLRPVKQIPDHIFQAIRIMMHTNEITDAARVLADNGHEWLANELNEHCRMMREHAMNLGARNG